MFVKSAGTELARRRALGVFPMRERECQNEKLQPQKPLNEENTTSYRAQNEDVRASSRPSADWPSACIALAAWAHSYGGLRGKASEGEGAHSPGHANRSHLPLRGKLGWMTPRPGVKTTPGMECAFWGSRSQAGAPSLFCLLPDFRPAAGASGNIRHILPLSLDSPRVSDRAGENCPIQNSIL